MLSILGLLWSFLGPFVMGGSGVDPGWILGGTSIFGVDPAFLASASDPLKLRFRANWAVPPCGGTHVL